MISSMTGYGQAIKEVDGVSYAVEIRTVNNRYFKVALRIPEQASFLEDKVERLLRSRLDRGMINYSLRMKDTGLDDMMQISHKTLRGYIDELKIAAEQANCDYSINLADLLSLPGVIQPFIPDQAQMKQLEDVVLGLTESAIENLKTMRTTEGKALRDDMLKNCRNIHQHIDNIRPRSSVVTTEYYEKLRKRADDLLKNAQLKIDEQILAREVAIFADRCDVSEELARLDSHIEQFINSCDGNQAVGRKLDFITQEMLREANTIASKASDPEIAQNVVEIKCYIDRIKEQVQNVE
jgi:uncharacterized protein (TIGR00255 family)